MTVIPDRQQLEKQGPTGYPTKRIVRVSTQFHPRQMLGYVKDGQRVTGEIWAHKIISARNLHTYRERDKPDVVVDGKTTFSSSVSMALIVSKAEESGRLKSPTVASNRSNGKAEGDARDGLP